MNPGLNQILGVVCSADVADIENVTTIESVDVSCHHSADTWREVGYGLPVDHPDLPAMLEKYTAVFADSVYLKADCFGLELDEVVFSYELGACTKDVDLGWYQLPKGSLGGSYVKYQGLIDGVPRVETHLEWQMTPHTDPSWDIKGCYITQIKGDPQVYNKHMIFPAPGVDLSDPPSFASIGMTVTGMPALHAIRSVVAAPPGIVTSADLPLRAFAGRFKLYSTAAPSPGRRGSGRRGRPGCAGPELSVQTASAANTAPAIASAATPAVQPLATALDQQGPQVTGHRALGLAVGALDPRRAEQPRAQPGDLEHQPRVGGRSLDGVQHRGQRVVPGVEPGRHRLAEPRQPLGHVDEEHLVLGGEVPVEGALGDPDLGRDGGHAGVLEAVLDEVPDRRLRAAPPGCGPTSRARCRGGHGDQDDLPGAVAHRPSRGARRRPRPSGKVSATTTRSQPSSMPVTRSSRAAVRSSVPGSAPSPKPSCVIPRSAAAGLGISVATRSRSLATASERSSTGGAPTASRTASTPSGACSRTQACDVLAEVERLDAQLPEHVVVGGQRGAEHPRAAVPRQLGGVQPDAAGGAVEQDRLAVGHPGRRDQVRGGGAGEHQPGRLLPRHPGRLGHAAARLARPRGRRTRRSTGCTITSSAGRQRAGQHHAGALAAEQDRAACRGRRRPCRCRTSRPRR